MEPVTLIEMKSNTFYSEFLPACTSNYFRVVLAEGTFYVHKYLSYFSKNTLSTVCKY